MNGITIVGEDVDSLTGGEGAELVAADRSGGLAGGSRDGALVREADNSPKAYRWVGKLEETSATFDHFGLTFKIFQGAADIYRFVETTTIG